jgi:hypothetical protein
MSVDSACLDTSHSTSGLTLREARQFACLFLTPTEYSVHKFVLVSGHPNWLESRDSSSQDCSRIRSLTQEEMTSCFRAPIRLPYLVFYSEVYLRLDWRRWLCWNCATTKGACEKFEDGTLIERAPYKNVNYAEA